MTSSLIRRYDIIIIILMSRQLKKWKVFIVSMFMDGLNLKFSVRGNFRLLISNIRDGPLFFIRSHFFFKENCLQAVVE